MEEVGLHEVRNVLMPAVSLGQGFGRIGCFFAGCCYGIRTTAWYGVEFPAESLGPGAGIKVIPTELISSAGNFLIFAFLLRNLLRVSTLKIQQRGI